MARAANAPLPTREEVRDAYLTTLTVSPLNHHPDYMVGVGPNWREDFDAAAARLSEAAEVLFADRYGRWPVAGELDEA